MKYIGLMSGTSLDAIDVALVDFSTPLPTLLATLSKPLSSDLRTRLKAFHEPSFDEITRLGALDHILGHQFADAILQLLQEQGLTPKDITAVGSHGLTIRHHPQGAHPFTLQIADPNIIATKTGITTVADFRRKDIAVKGQGAPLAPAFHEYVFRDATKPRVIVNIGGIANITLLLPGQPIIGFDTGPGNCLMDVWCEQHTGKPFDQYGAWATTGKINLPLLQTLLEDSYFERAHPKSTGREYFNDAWLLAKMVSDTRANDLLYNETNKHGVKHQAIPSGPFSQKEKNSTACDPRITLLFQKEKLQNDSSPETIQATLLALTATTIIKAIHQHTKMGDIIVCGGGAHNTALMQAIQQQTACVVASTQAYGINPNWIEAMAFAWFAKSTLEKKPIPTVTGATRPAVLGGVYYA